MNRARSIVLISFIFGFLGATAQQKLTTTSGEINFTSNAQLEMIKAASNKVQGMVDPANNQFAFSVQVQTFKGFNTELQRQHFNDNYLESEKYPKASFAGKIIEEVDYTKDGTYEVRAKGNLDIHGQKQTRIIKSKITIKNGIVTIEALFAVPLTDHNITIPKIVNQKIATEIEVSFKATMVVQ
jgi:polyisoprenoid-binding protein YceI